MLRLSECKRELVLILPSQSSFALFYSAKLVYYSHVSKKKAMTSLAKKAFYSQTTISRGKSIHLALPRVPLI